MKKVILVSEVTHKKLVELGRKGETFDEIVKRLLSFYLKYQKQGEV